jgi:hypothetical protein
MGIILFWGIGDLEIIIFLGGIDIGLESPGVLFCVKELSTELSCLISSDSFSDG